MNERKEFGASELSGGGRSGIRGDIACGEHGLGEIGVADMTATKCQTKSAHSGWMADKS